MTDTFGGALYTLNFLLYGAATNLTGVNFHMTTLSFTAAWQPVTVDGVAPYPRPLYYGHAAFNQIIGPTCTAQVATLPLASLPTGYDGYVSAYSIYQAGTLSSIAILNAKEANSTSTSFANLTISLTLPTSMAGKTVHLAYLTAAGIDSKYNTTWNGLSFEQSGDGTPTTVSDAGSTTTVGSDGTLTVAVRDSQAVVAQIGAAVGSLTVDETACSAMASAGTHSGNGAADSSATSKPESDGTASSSSGGGESTVGADSGAIAGRMALASGGGVWLTLLVPCLSLMAGFFIF